ncbi:MAG: hypothetical protein KJ879_00175 [Nanoarchaeota archaeon]|nr:hypothetical protein [Nanoarchaeota archaeon]
MRNLKFSKSKRGAMELSVGTIVVFVLAMSVLVLGIFLVQKIFGVSTTAIDGIDQSIKDEISKLFSQDESKQIVVYPASRSISIKQGDSGGFGFSLRNIENLDETFSYSVSVMEISSNCQIAETEAESLLILGKIGTDISIPSGQTLENPILVKFDVPKSTPLCDIRYGLNVKDKSGDAYIPVVTIDLEIK